ncbi:MAG: type IV secretion system protein [Asticcacaulis sp.]|uniref:type IV secretion system protein n=1 Tax=Asticcacaulis sp. TaxID=1872648 RepID=UPI003F7B93B4
MPVLPVVSHKSVSAIAVVLALALPATAAYAIGGLGDIVYDPSNYLQAVRQVQAWEQQYQQMTQSLAKAEATFQQAKAQVDAVTGVRGFGDILNNPLLRNVVPADLSSTLTGLNSTGALSGKALELRKASAVYDCGDMTEAGAEVSCQALLGQNAQVRAIQQDTMVLLNERTTQIDALRGQIDATQDPKAIAELQARLEAEQAQVANDQNKIALANAMMAANAQAAAQAEQERVNALMASNKTSALDGFAFTSLGYQPGTQVADVEQ